MNIDNVQKTVKFVHIVKLPTLSLSVENIVSLNDVKNLSIYYSDCQTVLSNALDICSQESNISIIVFKDIWQLQDNLNSLKDIDIFILSGDIKYIDNFSTFSDSFWYQNQKIVVEEKFKNIVMNCPDEFYKFQSSQYENKIQSANAIWKSDEDKRITKLAHLMNQDLSIVDIAKELNVTRSAVYLMRNQYRIQLEALVDRGKKAMRFQK